MASFAGDNRYFLRLNCTSHVGFRFEEVKCVAASLLLVVLVWPFIQVVDALSMILDNGMTWEFSTSSPLMSLIFASVISAMVWAVAIFIPDA